MENQNKVLKKISVKKVELAKEPVGFELQGRFKGFTKSEPFKNVNQQTGEITEKTLTNAIFEKGDERLSVIADAGLQSALRDSMVKEGDEILIRKLPKAALKGGRTMNQYDIFAVQG